MPTGSFQTCHCGGAMRKLRGLQTLSALGGRREGKGVAGRWDLHGITSRPCKVLWESRGSDCAEVPHPTLTRLYLCACPHQWGCSFDEAKTQSDLKKRISRDCKIARSISLSAQRDEGQSLAVQKKVTGSERTTPRRVGYRSSYLGWEWWVEELSTCWRSVNGFSFCCDLPANKQVVCLFIITNASQAWAAEASAGYDIYYSGRFFFLSAVYQCLTCCRHTLLFEGYTLDKLITAHPYSCFLH